MHGNRGQQPSKMVPARAKAVPLMALRYLGAQSRRGAELQWIQGPPSNRSPLPPTPDWIRETTVRLCMLQATWQVRSVSEAAKAQEEQ
jgi:hypothetical protein